MVSRLNEKTVAEKGIRSARQIALDILIRVFKTQSYADLLLANKLQQSHLSVKDRALVSEIVYGTLRWWGWLNWLFKSFYHGPLQKIPHPALRNLEMALYQILFLDRVPAYAVVDEAVQMAKDRSGQRWANTTNGLLRTVLRTQSLPEPPDIRKHPVQGIATRLSHPEWLVERWVDEFGVDRTLQLCRANNDRPKICLRVNRLKTDTDSLIKDLTAQGFELKKSEWLDEIVILEKASEILDTQAFHSGRISIQDTSAAFVAHLVHPQPGETILDIAAAPGGKSMHMAELSGDVSLILACDLHHSRLRRLVSNKRRHLLSSLLPVIADGRAIPFRGIDKILIDAPCSGIGVLRRRPELRWRIQEKNVTELVHIQRQLLDSAAATLSVNGVLVYSTCTVLQDENQNQIDWFLEKYPYFVLEPASRFVKDGVVKDAMIQTWPDLHHIDGSFAARMRRIR